MTDQKSHFAKPIEGHSLEMQNRVHQELSDHLTNSVNGIVTTLLINTRRSSTKWRSGKYHLTGRTDKTYHLLGVCERGAAH